MSAARPIRSSRSRRDSSPNLGHNKLLGLVLRTDGWWAAVQALGARQHEAVLFNLVPVEELKSGQRKKAARWLKSLRSPVAELLLSEGGSAAHVG